MNELELFKINYDNDRITLSARDLHEFLEIKTQFKDWFPRMVEYGFKEGSDFSSFLSESTGGRPATDYQITIEMAKELAMLQRNEKGKQARQYFIELEKRWNSPECVMNRALEFSRKQVDRLLHENLELKPKALFADAVASSKTSILIGDLAKILKQNGYGTGSKRLFETLRNDGWLIKGGSSKNMPTQKGMEMGLFEIKETTVNNPDGSIRITRTPKISGKGQIFFVNKYCKTN